MGDKASLYGKAGFSLIAKKGSNDTGNRYTKTSPGMMCVECGRATANTVGNCFAFGFVTISFRCGSLLKYRVQ